MSDLMRKYGSFDLVQKAMKTFLESSNVPLSVFVATTTATTNDEIVSIKPLGEVETNKSTGWWYYMIRPPPTSGSEGISAIWQRHIEGVKEEISSVSPGLWKGAFERSVIVGEFVERDIRVVVVPSAISAGGNRSAPAILTSSTGGGKLGFKIFPGPATVSDPKPSSAAPAVKIPPRSGAKYQVPLDSLGGGDAPGTPERHRDEAEEVSSEIVGKTVDGDVMDVCSSSIGCGETVSEIRSPVNKRQRMESSAAAEETAVGPEFRDVVIKKKVVVSEYEMNENGEMIVRDVEKMVEEIIREPVKKSSNVNRGGLPRSAAGSGGGGPKKSPAAGQGTLTGFFKKSN